MATSQVISTHEKSSYIFIDQDAATNPIEVVLHLPINWKTLYLMEYSVHGVPVTSSIPNDTHFDLTFERIDNFRANAWVHVDGSSQPHLSVPLMLTGELSHQTFPHPRLITDMPSTNIQKFALRLRTPDATDATFSRAAFVFFVRQ